MSEICIIGKHGLIGSALAKRYGRVTSFPTKDTKILFHFGSPVHPPFEQNPDYHMNEILSSFMYLLPYCRDNNIYFVYPSSALVYEKDTLFSKTKRLMELYASCYPRTLGLRIFPVYGGGEDRTVISQWCKAMKEDRQPVIYGDGNQKRDFIYIEDAIDQIQDLVERRIYGVKDVGIGKPVSFNNIVATINNLLGKDIKPAYMKAPEDYSKGIVCLDPGRCTTNLTDGIRKVLEK
jgi:UDP-glucose 4-epimerase